MLFSDPVDSCKPLENFYKLIKALSLASIHKLKNTQKYKLNREKIEKSVEMGIESKSMVIYERLMVMKPCGRL